MIKQQLFEGWQTLHYNSEYRMIFRGLLEKIDNNVDVYQLGIVQEETV